MSKILFSINSVPYSSYRIMLFLYGKKSKQANRGHTNPAGKHTRLSSVIHTIFHVFTSEDMENTSVLIYGKGMIWVKYEIFS